MNKVTPIEKVYEAWSALADDRVELLPGSDRTEGLAKVQSSDRTKIYTVSWQDDGKLWKADDNSTYWAGYPGYPVLAVMMKIGYLPFDADVAKLYKGINWTLTNKKFKADYAKAVEAVQKERGIDPALSLAEAQKVIEELSERNPEVKRGRFK